MVKNEEESEKIRHLDEKDRRILNILGENARSKLTKIAGDIGLSVDSTKKRIAKLERIGVIRRYTIEPDPGKIGIGFAVHVYIKLKDIDKEKYEALIDAMKKNPRVIDLMAMLGDYDLYIVFLAKDAREFETMKLEFREKFGGLIGDWKEVIVSKIYKLEEYRF
ncbi:MAG: Lrp/AsnC family transcriptional regulator [Candidatus Aenigmarchaeota archaeon]|nr:Lrp/AsnC family transcriptional regulator [Candidatus Aenigmarchaeota archaeon]